MALSAVAVGSVLHRHYFICPRSLSLARLLRGRGREFSLIGTSGVFDRGMAKDGFIIVNLRRVEHVVRLISLRLSCPARSGPGPINKSMTIPPLCSVPRGDRQRGQTTRDKYETEHLSKHRP